MAGTPSKKRKHPGPRKQPPRGNPQKARESRDPRHIEKATFGDWVGAARLRTLPLAVTPILIGTGAAMLVDGLFHWVLALLCLVVSVSLQIARQLRERLQRRHPRHRRSPRRPRPPHRVEEGLSRGPC